MIEYWTRFEASPIWVGISLLITVNLWGYLVAYVTQKMSVEGSHRAYVSSTILKTLCLPLFAAFVFEVALDVFTRDWFSAMIDAWLAYNMQRDWERIKDNDDWWKGKGTKLKKKLRSFFSTSSTVAAGAGA